MKFMKALRLLFVATVGLAVLAGLAPTWAATPDGPAIPPKVSPVATADGPAIPPKVSSLTTADGPAIQPEDPQPQRA